MLGPWKVALTMETLTAWHSLHADDSPRLDLVAFLSRWSRLQAQGCVGGDTEKKMLPSVSVRGNCF